MFLSRNMTIVFNSFYVLGLLTLSFDEGISVGILLGVRYGCCLTFYHVVINRMFKNNKITKKLNSEENSNRKVPNQMAKSKAQSHQISG